MDTAFRARCSCGPTLPGGGRCWRRDHGPTDPQGPDTRMPQDAAQVPAQEERKDEGETPGPEPTGTDRSRSGSAPAPDTTQPAQPAPSASSLRPPCLFHPRKQVQCRLDRTRCPGQAVSLCGAPEGRVEVSGARVEHTDMAILLEPPFSTGSGGNSANGPNRTQRRFESGRTPSANSLARHALR